MLGAGWVSFLRFFLLAFSGRSGRSSGLGLRPSTPPASPSPHSARSLSSPFPPTPPPTRPDLPPPPMPALFGEGASARGTDKRAWTDSGGTSRQLPTTWPLPPRAAGSSPLPSPAGEVWGVRAPEASAFPGLIRANRSAAAGAEPPGASNTKECTGRGWGRRSENRGSALRSQAGEPPA